MYQFAKRCLCIAAALLTVAFVIPAAADVELTDVSWETIGSSVRFHLQFHNPDQMEPSGDVSGVLSSQPFGAFVPNNGVITSFNVPPMQPSSFFDVFYDIPLADLPPSADVYHGGGGGGGGTGANLSPTLDCPPANSWAGNVDVFWTGAGGTGNVNYHFGTIQVCAGGPPTCIHVITGCDILPGITWSFGPAPSGWSASLHNDSGMLSPAGPASNPIPPTFWDGWICVSAGASVPNGATSCVNLNLTCGDQTSVITVCSEACVCGSVATEESTWGGIKELYKNE
jgi:hypothetical protein